MKRIIILFLLVFIIRTGSAYTIYGRVIDGPKKEKVFGAFILLFGENRDTLSAGSDMEGQFKFENIKPGNYSIKVIYTAHEDTTFSNIKIDRDTTVTLDIHRFCKYDASTNNKTCPVCHKKDQVIPIRYGLLVGEPGKGKKGKGLYSRTSSSQNSDRIHE